MSSAFRVIAIVSAYNEEDIIGQTLAHLIEEGVDVYLLDHASTDHTHRIASAFLGRGLISIEPFPGDRDETHPPSFIWTDILTRKAQLSQELTADWFIHHDADEFRESPWEGVRLADAIERVDRLGYNAIDFELFDFWPTDDRFRPGDDPREMLRYYAPTDIFNKHQVKCWKSNVPGPLDLVSSGGHDVAFPNRRVFPLRFILRHYSLRSDTQAKRKIFDERLGRLVPDEVARQWHVQYGPMRTRTTFIRNLAELIEYDSERARFELITNHRGVEALQSDRDAARRDAAAQLERAASLDRELEHTRANVSRLKSAVDECRAEAERSRSEATRISQERDELLSSHAQLTASYAQLTAAHERLTSSHAQLNADLVDERRLVTRLLADIRSLQREIAALRASRTWRWTAPLRRLFE